jgi:hypothetical protein
MKAYFILFLTKKNIWFICDTIYNTAKDIIYSYYKTTY